MTRFLTSGNGTFVKVFLLYSFLGGMTVLLRLLLGRPRRELHSVLKDDCELDQPKWQPRVILTSPRVRVLLCFLFITLLLPQYPWRHMTATLGYEVIVATFTVLIRSQLHHHEPTIRGGEQIMYGDPLGTRNYNPTEDPYYVSNLDQPVNEFIASALEGLEFTNIVHIVLESMREDSFPFRDDALLNQYIHSNLNLLEPVSSETITPFMSTLAEHTLSWHTVWTTVPFTHKSMIGCRSLWGFRVDC